MHCESLCGCSQRPLLLRSGLFSSMPTAHILFSSRLIRTTGSTRCLMRSYRKTMIGTQNVQPHTSVGEHAIPCTPAAPNADPYMTRTRPATRLRVTLRTASVRSMLTAATIRQASGGHRPTPNLTRRVPAAYRDAARRSRSNRSRTCLFCIPRPSTTTARHSRRATNPLLLALRRGCNARCR
ncbi:hypothetical protein BKA62DRAFT_715124 [Auriculariales sp. MPI-PUGE-AT-0066]|nr:hypothetical protein BKA62DRAFT_715124 [Auriculariales sp. MPI-PUGE-AT-0066]